MKFILGIPVHFNQNSTLYICLDILEKIQLIKKLLLLLYVNFVYTSNTPYQHVLICLI